MNKLLILFFVLIGSTTAATELTTLNVTEYTSDKEIKIVGIGFSTISSDTVVIKNGKEISLKEITYQVATSRNLTLLRKTIRTYASFTDTHKINMIDYLTN